MNDMYHRRVSLVLSQYVELLVGKYNESEDEGEKKELFDDITAYADIAVEEAKLATDRSQHVYSNWGTRANVYSKMVGVGFKVYSKSALTTTQRAASLNPLNYELYYNAAQLYVVNNDNGSALKTLNQVFTINPEHIPSNILAGELSMNDKDYRQADRYFTNAKDIMEKYGDIDSELYKYVIKRLNEITPLLPSPEVKDNNTKTDDTNQNEGDGGDSEETETN
jgi:tetratricopeptide (TPR) repeat protein